MIDKFCMYIGNTKLFIWYTNGTIFKNWLIISITLIVMFIISDFKFNKSDSYILKLCKLIKTLDQKSKFIYESCGTRALDMYEENLKRNDGEKQFDIMKVYRNGILIFDRVEEPVKSPMQIEIESIEEEQRKLADRLSELRKGL